ncbi:MAG: hypothetical protein ACYDEP_13740 [Acidimicrobiales bacterium]
MRRTDGAQDSGTTPSDQGRRRTSQRPHWWAVLAVSLALMALISAVDQHASNNRASLARKRASSANSARNARGRPSVTVPTVRGSALGGPPTPSTSQAYVPFHSGAASTDSTSSSGGPPTVATSPTTTPSVTPTTPTTEARTPATTTVTEVGNLANPYTSTQYQVSTGSGEITANATWTGSTDLTLRIQCGSSANSATGPSGLSVADTSSAGTCYATISEPTSANTTVSYTLTITYPRP